MDRKREVFTEGSGVLHDAEYAAGQTMAIEPASAPDTSAAGEIDFAGDTAPDPRWFGWTVYNLPGEFVTRRARETVVSALQLQIRGTDSCGQKANAGEALRDAGQRLAAHFDAPGCKMNRKHAGLHLKNMSSSAQAELVCFDASCRERFAITEVLYNC